jgi:type IV secretory pathway VirB2 component (pilin)
LSQRRAAAKVNARWKPVFFISILMLVVAIGLFITAGDGSDQLTAAGIFVAAASMLFVAARNGKPPR